MNLKQKFIEQETKKAAINFAEYYNDLFENQDDYLLLDVHCNDFQDFDDFKTKIRVISDSEQSFAKYLYKVQLNADNEFVAKRIFEEEDDDDDDDDGIDYDD